MDNPFVEPENQYMCTVVSMLPMELEETKPHLIPGTFTIPAAPGGFDISVYHVGEAHSFVPDPILDRNLRVGTPPHELARSLVDDYCTAHICLTDNGGPGLFWVQGKFTADQIKKKFPLKVRDAAARQLVWYNTLINMADADWEKNKDMMAVSNLQRLAAKELNIDRDWVMAKVDEMMLCPFCKSKVTTGSVKCAVCMEVIDKTAYEKMKVA